MIFGKRIQSVTVILKRDENRLESILEIRLVRLTCGQTPVRKNLESPRVTEVQTDSATLRARLSSPGYVQFLVQLFAQTVWSPQALPRGV